ncbi:MAG: hypothetical protein ACRDA8_10755 [Shewanella sp.]
MGDPTSCLNIKHPRCVFGIYKPTRQHDGANLDEDAWHLHHCWLQSDQWVLLLLKNLAELDFAVLTLSCQIYHQ